MRVAKIVSTVAIGTLIALVWWSIAGTWLDLAVAVVSCALVPVALRLPVAAGYALSVLAMLSPVATPPATFAVLNVARQRSFPQALWVAIAGVAAHAIQGWWRPANGLSYWWWLVLMAAAYAALLGWGTWAQARQALIISLRERARRAEAEQGRRIIEARAAERVSIAREMHDVLAHRLSLIATYAGALEYRPDSPPERLAEAAGVIRTGVHQALDELREVITLLRTDPGAADDETAPGPSLADVPRLIEDAHAIGLTVHLDDQASLSAPTAPVTGRTAYRVIQEALTNARKHAAGQPVFVTVSGTPGERLIIGVRNKLSSEFTELPGTGTGLAGLTERVSIAGGQLDHEIVAAGEFHLQAWLPWRI